MCVFVCVYALHIVSHPFDTHASRRRQSIYIPEHVSVAVHAYIAVFACMCACERVSVRACVRVCVYVSVFGSRALWCLVI